MWNDLLYFKTLYYIRRSMVFFLVQQLSAHQEAARNMQAKASEDDRSERAEYLISMRQQFDKLQQSLNDKQQDDFKTQLLHAVERNKPEPIENINA